MSVVSIQAMIAELSMMDDHNGRHDSDIHDVRDVPEDR
jgi:hypothetical protein